MNKKSKDTSWNNSAEWYNDLLNSGGTYQSDLILPNLLRLLEIKPKEKVLDLACGTGFFSRAFANSGAMVTGVDLGPDLIKIAKRDSSSEIKYFVSGAEKLDFLASGSQDKVVVVLAAQNMADLDAVLKECSRVLKPNGKILLVLNHPAFRVPQGSEWGWDEVRKIQYRRVDKYLSESKIKIKMHPGKDETFTWTFHRPLQYYFKILRKHNFLVERLEEWNSHKNTPAGPRAAAENLARKEIPLFIFLGAVLQK